MIYSIFQFGDTLAREVMVPRIDMIALEITTPLQEAVSVIIQAGHSRIPVYEESIDHIRGLLYAKDLLVLWRDAQMDRPLKDLLRPAYFVPESKKAVDLLADLQQRKIHLAIVVDEYGGTAGLVTLEDLIEEIVGEIRDEHDLPVSGIRPQPDGTTNVDGWVTIRELNRVMNWNLPDEEATTIAGLVIHEAQTIPDVGQVFSFYGFKFEVLRRQRNQVTALRITPPAKAAVAAT
jgi:CBS domain containing-hemolysin-like protein